MGATQAKQVMAQLDPAGFVAVRPDHFVALLRAAQARSALSGGR
jgi:hypothetical protein